MKLYTSPGACSLADHIVLKWIGAPFEAQIVTREQRASPEYRAINPAGAVPALQVG
ncbi:MAG: glutathione S-transferase N-terminal domain-containing protein, partial [Proteobacteria bacterium]|nr:glutathione S-transferase N-terminal domain-containing protein [Pseudomonadota bacterium]